MRLYKYGGLVSENLLTINTSDITLESFVNGFDKKKLDGNVLSAINKIMLKATRDESHMAINMSDDRLVFVAVKMMIKYPEARYVYGVTEWFLVYRYLIQFYDKSVPNIDQLIRFINLFIGRKFVDGVALTASEYKEYKQLADMVSTTSEYENILPKFVLESLESKPTVLLTDEEDEIIYEQEVNDVFGNLLNLI